MTTESIFGALPREVRDMRAGQLTNQLLLAATLRRHGGLRDIDADFADLLDHNPNIWDSAITSLLADDPEFMSFVHSQVQANSAYIGHENKRILNERVSGNAAATLDAPMIAAGLREAADARREGALSAIDSELAVMLERNPRLWDDGIEADLQADPALFAKTCAQLTELQDKLPAFQACLNGKGQNTETPAAHNKQGRHRIAMMQ